MFVEVISSDIRFYFIFLDDVDVLKLYVRDDVFRKVLQHPHSLCIGLQ